MGLDGSGPDVRTWSLTCVFSRMADFPSSSSLVIYSKVYATPATVYLLGLAKSLASYTLHVTSLDAASGELIRSGDYPSSITTGLSQVFFLADVRTPETQPRVVWLEDGAIKSFPLVPDLKTKLSTVKGAVYKNIQDVGLSEHGQFVALTDDGSARVLKLTPEGLTVIWEFSDSVSAASAPKRLAN